MSGTRRNGHLLNESILSSRSSLTNGGFRDASKRNCCHKCWAWAKDGFTIIACCYGILTAAITIALAFQIRFGMPQVSPAGAVASDDGGCSKEAGLAMLKQGGSAVDAAVAALLCLSVTHPHLVGPGGGGIMLVHDHVQNRTRVIDFLPAVPASFVPHRRTSTIGGKSVAVPGFLQGLHTAHQRYGVLAWDALFQPAIATARRGFSVSASLDDALVPLNSALIPAPPPPLLPVPKGAVNAGGSSTINAFSATFVPFGARLKRGTTVTRLLYAQLLEKVAKYGPRALTELDYAVEVVELLRETGSSVRVSDILDYKVLEYDAVWSSYSNKTVFTIPGAGDVLLAVLQLLSNTGVNEASPPPEAYEHIVQALKLAQTVYHKMALDWEHRGALSATFRNLSADLNLHHIYQDVSEKSEQLFEAGQASQQLRQQNESSMEALRQLTNGVDEAALLGLPQQAATQVSVIDTYDLYVSVVAGMGSLFGSQLMTAHGVLLNNLLASVPHSASRFASQGRPLVPYAPFIVVDDLKVCGARLVCSSGSVEDSVQVLTHHLLRQLSPTAAIAQPRVALDTSNDLVLVDDLSEGLRLPGNVRNFLASRGYVLGMSRPPHSSVNSVVKVKDNLSSHSDPRGGGLAARLGSGGIDYQGKSSVAGTEGEGSVGAENTESGVAVDNDVSATNGNEGVSKDSNSNTGAELDSESLPNIASENNASSFLRYTPEGGQRYENAPTAPDSETFITQKKMKETTTVRSNTANKKYMGDASDFEKSANSPQGTGRVVKGDTRGGVRLVYHELDEKLKGVSPAGGGRVNGGRDAVSSVDLFSGGQSTVIPIESAAGPHLPAAVPSPPDDSVFSDYGPIPHMGQVRVDDYSIGEGDEERYIPSGADYVEAPINIWGPPGTRLIPTRSPQVAVLPGHLAHQLKKQIQKQQLEQQQQQKLQSHLQRQQQQLQLVQNHSPAEILLRPGQPGPGLPVVFQHHSGHLHPVLGSEASGQYEQISR